MAVSLDSISIKRGENHYKSGHFESCSYVREELVYSFSWLACGPAIQGVGQSSQQRVVFTVFNIPSLNPPLRMFEARNRLWTFEILEVLQKNDSNLASQPVSHAYRPPPPQTHTQKTTAANAADDFSNNGRGKPDPQLFDFKLSHC